MMKGARCAYKEINRINTDTELWPCVVCHTIKLVIYASLPMKHMYRESQDLSQRQAHKHTPAVVVHL